MNSTTEQLDNPATSRLGDDVVLSVRNVSKKFCKNLRRSMAYGIGDLARNLVGRPSESTELRKDEFWALKDINFELRRGEVLGVIGPNGCGKTTLLRLLAGIFPPDRGAISVRGRVGALIAVGAGFHPHMSGRENIYLNGTILGMSRREIRRKFDDIVEFAELEDFIDAPVSSYSSGMRVRLGFAIAVQVNPELLLVDEVLAVGDAGFQAKCYDRIFELLQHCAVCVVSHRMSRVSRLCRRVIVLDHGVPSYYESTGRAIAHYNRLVTSRREEYGMRYAVPGARLEELKIEPLDSRRGFFTGEPARIVVSLVLPPGIHDCIVAIGILDSTHTPCAYTQSEPFSVPSDGRDIKIEFQCNELRFVPDNYALSVVAFEPSSGRPLVWHFGVNTFEIKGAIKHAGIPVILNGDWHVRAQRQNTGGAS